eukprot:768559-Hanusia_phi.AAC.2
MPAALRHMAGYHPGGYHPASLGRNEGRDRERLFAPGPQLESISTTRGGVPGRIGLTSFRGTRAGL